jgi:hypothetical protein
MRQETIHGLPLIARGGQAAIYDYGKERSSGSPSGPRAGIAFLLCHHPLNGKGRSCRLFILRLPRRSGARHAESFSFP